MLDRHIKVFVDFPVINFAVQSRFIQQFIEYFIITFFQLVDQCDERFGQQNIHELSFQKPPPHVWTGDQLGKFIKRRRNDFTAVFLDAVNQVLIEYVVVARVHISENGHFRTDARVGFYLFEQSDDPGQIIIFAPSS